MSVAPTGYASRQVWDLIDLIKRPDDFKAALVQFDEHKEAAQAAEASLADAKREHEASLAAAREQANAEAKLAREGAEADAQTILDRAHKEVAGIEGKLKSREDDVAAREAVCARMEREQREKDEDLNALAESLKEREAALETRVAWYDAQISAVEALTGKKAPA